MKTLHSKIFLCTSMQNAPWYDNAPCPLISDGPSRSFTYFQDVFAHSTSKGLNKEAKWLHRIEGIHLFVVRKINVHALSEGNFLPLMLFQRDTKSFLQTFDRSLMQGLCGNRLTIFSSNLLIRITRIHFPLENDNLFFYNQYLTISRSLEIR